MGSNAWGGGSDFPKLGRRIVGLFEMGRVDDATTAFGGGVVTTALGSSFLTTGGGVSGLGFFVSSLGGGATLSENPGMNKPVVVDSVSSSSSFCSSSPSSLPSSVSESDVARRQRSSLLRQRWVAVNGASVSSDEDPTDEAVEDFATRRGVLKASMISCCCVASKKQRTALNLILQVDLM